MKKLMAIVMMVTMFAGLSYAQRITEDLANWTFGPNPPEVTTGVRGDGSTGAYHHMLVGTSAYYYEVAIEGEGLVEFWIKDVGNCMQAANPGYDDNGPRWGLQNPSYQAVTVGISRQDWVAGCLGYSPWSTVAPYSPLWFKDGVRGTNGVPWSPGWYKWTINGTMDDITFTLCNVTYCIADGPPDDDVTTGDCVQTFNATAPTDWAAVFGMGWKAIWLKGDPTGGVEDFGADVTSGTGAFAELGTSVARPYNQTTWGNMKALYR